jgi:stage III sporulation protein AA
MNEKIQEFSDAISNINPRIREFLKIVPEEIKADAQEICLKVGRIPIIFTPKISYFIDKDRNLIQSELLVSSNDLRETIKILCNFSIYCFQNQIKNGFITVKGGCRAGICGTAIISKNEITNISEVSSIDLRITREIIGCSNKIFEKFGCNLGGTIIAGPPASGKTTVLRDIARRISISAINNRLIKTVIVDERRELAATYLGVPQKDIGFSDVLSDFPKGIGILQATRTLAPDIIVCDEIGSRYDAAAIRESLNSGVEIIASVHARSPEEIARSERIRDILNSGEIKRVILLNSCNTPGTVRSIYDIKGKEINSSDF